MKMTKTQSETCAFILDIFQHWTWMTLFLAESMTCTALTSHHFKTILAWSELQMAINVWTLLANSAGSNSIITIQLHVHDHILMSSILVWAVKSSVIFPVTTNGHGLQVKYKSKYELIWHFQVECLFFYFSAVARMFLDGAVLNDRDRKVF